MSRISLRSVIKYVCLRRGNRSYGGTRIHKVITRKLHRINRIAWISRVNNNAGKRSNSRTRPINGYQNVVDRSMLVWYIRVTLY